MRKKGFTLIELMTIAAILSMLAAILILLLLSPQERAIIARGMALHGQANDALAITAVGIWDMNEGQGNSTSDISVNRHHGTITGNVPWTDDTPYHILGRGAGKHSLDFDGSGGYVEVQDQFSLRNAFHGGGTVTAWVKTRSGSVDVDEEKKGVIVGKEDGTNGWKLFVQQHPGWGDIYTVIFQHRFGNGAEWGTTSSGRPPQLNEWTHIAVTYNADDPANKPTFYINGQAARWRCYAPPSAPSDPQECPAGGVATFDDGIPLRIGRNATNSSNFFFDGFISEVRVYGSELTVGEIERIYAESALRHQVTTN